MKDLYKKLPVFSLANYLLSNKSLRYKKMLLFGNFGAMNVGDESILAGQLQDLNKLTGISLSVVSRFPDEVRKIHSVRSTDLFNLFLVLKSITSSDVIIVGGGGLFCKITTGLTGLLFQMYFITLFMLIPALLRKRIILYGIGYYPNMNTITKQYGLILLRLVELITVRDKVTFDYLQPKISNVMWAKDNSFLMALLPTSQIKQSNILKQFNKSRINVGIALKNLNSPKEHNLLLKKMTDFIVNNSKKYDYWLYSLDHHPHYENDYQLNIELSKLVQYKINKISKCKLIDTSYSHKEIFSSFQMMDRFIAMRLHSMIFAYRMGINFIGISYDEKCDSFLSSIGKPSYSVEEIINSQVLSK